VAADHVTVSKHGDLTREALRFRYVTADKRQQVVFDRRTGTGTVLDDTLYHQRLRPALEYVELVELVRVAAELEAAFGLPLDIEFAFDGPQLCILQARPVAPLLAALRETAERFPLRPREGCP
jgi:phosphoenolpyruvate synthase/pyruvate phosphate dikinase